MVTRGTRAGYEQEGRRALEQALKKQNLPYKKVAGSAVLAGVIRETGFKKAEDFYLALGSGKLPATQIVNKVIQRLKTTQVAEEEAVPLKASKVRDVVAGENLGITVKGVEDVLVRIAKCCTPVPGDAIVGYISLGKGITIHREDCPNTTLLRKSPERFADVYWEGDQATGFVVEIQIDGWDRPRLVADLSAAVRESCADD